MTRFTLVFCAAFYIQQSTANAQCLTCGTQQPVYYYVMPMQQPAYYYAAPQPMCYSVDSWTVCKSCAMSPCSYDSEVGYEPCKPGSETYTIVKPVREIDEFGNVITRWVPEQRTRTYITTQGAVSRPLLVQVPYKGKPLTLTNKLEQGQLETLLISIRKAVTNTTDLRLGARSCIEQGNLLDVEFVRVSDETTGHVSMQLVDDAIEMTLWLRPAFGDPNQPTPDTQSTTKDDAKNLFLAVREQLAKVLGVSEPTEE